MWGNGECLNAILTQEVLEEKTIKFFEKSSPNVISESREEKIVIGKDLMEFYARNYKHSYEVATSDKFKIITTGVRVLLARRCDGSIDIMKLIFGDRQNTQRLILTNRQIDATREL